MRLEPETRIQRWRRYWRLSWREQILRSLAVIFFLALIWGVADCVPFLLKWLAHSRAWLGIPQSYRYSIVGSTLLAVGGFSMRARMKKRALGVRTYWDLHILIIDISMLVGGVVSLVRAALA